MPDVPAALVVDPARLGLQRRTVETVAGRLLVHAGPRVDGPATILLHGAAGSWTTWTPLLAAAEAGRRPLRNVLAIDLPGWGGSPGPVPPIAVVSAAVAQVAASFAEWDVLGHSLGGFLALDLAVRRPDAVRTVGLVSPTGPAVVRVVRHPLRGGVRLPWFAGMVLAMGLATALPGRRLIRGLHGLGLLRPLSAPLFAGRADPSVLAALAEEVRPRSFLAAVRAAAGYDLERWHGIRCPVRSVRGARDVFVGRDDGAALAALVPGFAERVLPGAGHFAAVEQPDAVLAFLLPPSRRMTRE